MIRDVVVLPQLHVSGAEIVTGNSDKVDVGRFIEAVALLNITAVAGTTPTLDIKIQTSDDGSDWYDLNPASAIAQKNATGKDSLKLTNFGKFIRAVWTIGGTTPSFTFTLKLVAKV